MSSRYVPPLLKGVPTLLQELCEGTCGAYREVVYRMDYPNGVVLWMCQGCWGSAWSERRLAR